MGYAANDDPYINPETGVLKNRIGAKTQTQLDKTEAEITYIIIATLTQGSKVGTLKFDTELLLDIHKEIFGDIYRWAGKIRTHDISKDWAYFAHAEYIFQSLEVLLTELQKDEKLKSGSKDHFIDQISYYYSELNAIHPFREGNGRAIRTFLRLLALKYNYDIEWGRMDGAENIRASQMALKGKNTIARKMLAKLVVKL